MTLWNTALIAKEAKERIDETTADWTIDEVRASLASLLAAITPIRTTLEGLIDNPEAGDGSWVTSGLFFESFSHDPDFDEPWGLEFVPSSETTRSAWEPLKFEWSDPPPKVLHAQADFSRGEVPHDDTIILSVVQSFSIASVFRGSFDISDVKALSEAFYLKKPVL